MDSVNNHGPQATRGSDPWGIKSSFDISQTIQSKGKLQMGNGGERYILMMALGSVTAVGAVACSMSVHVKSSVDITGVHHLGLGVRSKWVSAGQGLPLLDTSQALLRSFPPIFFSWLVL